MKLETQVHGLNNEPDPNQAEEDVFRNIVKNHAGLVYATALRQTGNHTLAEEITQNVFLALAGRGNIDNAPTLSAWLYRAAILESKQRVRTELRRQQREQAAVDLGTIHPQPEDSIWAALAPMLDEAIMSLKESDRLAVILRFFEDKPLREVGAALGISDDTAQKRIGRCLDDLTRFFRRRGFLAPALTGSIPLLKSTTHAAPAGILDRLAREMAREAAIAGASGTSAWFLTLTTMNTIKTVIACSTAALLPVAWQWNEIAHLRAAQEAVMIQAAELEANVNDAALKRDELRSHLKVSDASLAALRAKIHAATNSPLLTPSKPDVVLWSESSDYVRVPKRTLDGLYIKALKEGDGAYALSDEICTVLRLTPQEVDSVTSSLHKLQEKLAKVEESHITPVTNHVTHASAGGTIDQASYRVTPYAKEGDALREELRNSFKSAIGDDREKTLWQNLAASLAVKSRNFGSVNELVTLCLVDPGSPKAEWPNMLMQTSEYYGEDGSVSGTSAGPCIDLSTIPPALQPTIQAWKARAETMVRNLQKQP